MATRAHLRIQRAKARIAAHIDVWTFGRQGRRRFRGDARYDLRNVTNGFRSHIEEAVDDTPLLERICAAYNHAMEAQKTAPGAYEWSTSWRALREGNLKPFIRALTEVDTPALGRMLRNFYRDPCSSGLLAAPHGMSRAYFGPRIRDVYSHYYLSHVLSRFEYWKELTRGRFNLKDLAGPGVGNPFGVVIDGTHIGVGSEYSHYCAHRAIDLLDKLSTKVPLVAEIGVGFGAITYYLLRDHGPITYVGLDCPERIALSSFYLLKAFPKHRFLLFGEKALSAESIREPGVILLPAFALSEIPQHAVDVTFSSLAFGAMSAESMRECLAEIDRITGTSLLVIDNRAASDRLAILTDEEQGSFRLRETLSTAWHSRGKAGAGRKNDTVSASSELVEQYFSRMRERPLRRKDDHMTPW
jgi:hypothetical protein